MSKPFRKFAIIKTPKVLNCNFSCQAQYFMRAGGVWVANYMAGARIEWNVLLRIAMESCCLGCAVGCFNAVVCFRCW